MSEQNDGTAPRRNLPPVIFIILTLCTVVSILAAFTMAVCAILSGLGTTTIPLPLFITLGAVLVTGCLVIPLAVALAWSIVLMTASAERPVRTAFKGVFGFVNRAMQVISVPFVP